MSLCEVKVEISPAGVDAADDYLLEAGEGGWSVHQDVIVGRAWLVGIFEGQAEAAAHWSELSPRLAEAGVEILAAPEFRALGESDWKDSYKAHFKASHFGRLHWVPEWERGAYACPAGDVVLWLDPGLAFGTGNHETTRLCCERLVAHAASGGVATGTRVIDAGCGSGILALSATLLGYPIVAAFDNDPEAVRISRENAELNGLQGRVDFYEGDLVTGLVGRQADLVMANILADVLMRFADNLIGAVAPGGTLVLSGILARELEAVRSHFAARADGWTVDTRVMGEWGDVQLVRPVRS